MLDWLRHADWIKLLVFVSFILAARALLAPRLHPPKVVDFASREDRIRAQARESRDIVLGLVILFVMLLLALWSRHHP